MWTLPLMHISNICFLNFSELLSTCLKNPAHANVTIKSIALSSRCPCLTSFFGPSHVHLQIFLVFFYIWFNFHPTILFEHGFYFNYPNKSVETSTFFEKCQLLYFYWYIMLMVLVENCSCMICLGMKSTYCIGLSWWRDVLELASLCLGYR